MLISIILPINNSSRARHPWAILVQRVETHLEAIEVTAVMKVGEMHVVAGVFRAYYRRGARRTTTVRSRWESITLWTFVHTPWQWDAGSPARWFCVAGVSATGCRLRYPCDRGRARNNIAEKIARLEVDLAGALATRRRVVSRGVENGTGHASRLLDGRACVIASTLPHPLGCVCSGLTIVYLRALPWPQLIAWLD